MEAAMGTKAPVATMPEILCSTASAMSNGFLRTVGIAMPAVSFRKQAPTSSSAGPQNHGLANHGRLAFSSGLARKYSYAPTALTPMSGEIATPVIRDTVSASFLACGFGSAVLAAEIAADTVRGSQRSPATTRSRLIFLMPNMISLTLDGCKAQLRNNAA